MNRREFIIVASAALGLVVATACGSSSENNPAPATDNTSAEPQVFDWSIGAAGGLGEGGAIITRFEWQPRNLQIPVNQPFKIRFVPRDELLHPITFIGTLEQEVGAEIPDVIVNGGLPSESAVMTVKATGNSFQVFCREHFTRGCAGFITT